MSIIFTANNFNDIKVINSLINHIIGTIEPNIINTIERSLNYYNNVIKEMLFNDMEININNELETEPKLPNKIIDKLKDIIKIKNLKKFNEFNNNYIDDIIIIINMIKLDLELLRSKLILLKYDINEKIKINNNLIYNYLHKIIGKINKKINKLKGQGFNIDYLIKSHNNKKISYIKESTILGQYYCETEFDYYKKNKDKKECKIIILHKTRKYNCFTTISSIESIINDNLKNLFLRVVKEKNDYKLKICLKCPGNKLDHNENKHNCDTILFLDDIFNKIKSYNDIIVNINNKLKNIIPILFKNQYGFDGIIYCPNETCVESLCLINNNILQKIHQRKINTTYISNFFKCQNCDSLVCSNCHKIHTNQQCVFDNEDKIENPNKFKYCPNKYCRIITEKVDMCNHLICKLCNIHWCWGCCDILDPLDPYNHKCSLINNENDNNNLNNENDNNENDNINNENINNNLNNNNENDNNENDNENENENNENDNINNENENINNNLNNYNYYLNYEEKEREEKENR